MTVTGTWRNIVLLCTLAAAWLWVAETRADGISEAKPSHSNVPPTADALPNALEGRAYYLLADDVTCRANTPERPRLKSWKNKLTFAQEKVLMWQTLCNDSPLVLDFDAHAFVVSHGFSSLTYEGETYTYYEHPPQLCAQGQWCPVDAPQGSKVQDREGTKNADTEGTSKAP